MQVFERGSVIRVPFPYTNRPIQQRRPAVVVSARDFQANSHLLWVVMITSAGNRPWPGDISLVETFAEIGLPAPSVIRPAKIATIEAEHADAIGLLPGKILTQLNLELRSILSV
jgi:mRNA interferase MazF